MGTETEYDDLNVSTDNRSASIIQIDNGKAVAAVAICAAFAALGVALSVHAYFTARDAATEYRILLNHYMELQAEVKEMRRGK